METAELETFDGAIRAEFAAQGHDEVQRLVAVIALGMCRAVALRLVTPGFACHRLFGPSLVALLRLAGAESTFVEAAELASELESVQRIVPDAFQSSLIDVEHKLIEALRPLALATISGEKWLITHELPTEPGTINEEEPTAE